MKFLNKIISFAVIALLSVNTTSAQIPPSAQGANPANSGVNKVGGGNTIDGSSEWVIGIHNAPQALPGGDPTIPIHAINVTIAFGGAFGLPANMTEASVNALLAPQGWEVDPNAGMQAGPGMPGDGYLVVRNIQAIPAWAELHITIPVDAFAPGSGWIGADLELSLPIRSTDLQGDNEKSSPVYTINPVPVKLLNFSVAKDGNSSLLDWATASEQNNKGFDIERSADGSNWNKIGFVKSNANVGNSSVKQSYVYTDNAPLSGTNFYRLKQTDFDGKFEYSDVRTIVFDGKNEIKVYPNPVIETVTINGLEGNESIKIYDLTGKLITQLKANSINVNIPFDQMIEGIYIIKITNENGYVSSHKVTKSK